MHERKAIVVDGRLLYKGRSRRWGRELREGDPHPEKPWQRLQGGRWIGRKNDWLRRGGPDVDAYLRRRPDQPDLSAVASRVRSALEGLSAEEARRVLRQVMADHPAKKRKPRKERDLADRALLGAKFRTRFSTRRLLAEAHRLLAEDGTKVPGRTSVASWPTFRRHFEPMLGTEGLAKLLMRVRDRFSQRH